MTILAPKGVRSSWTRSSGEEKIREEKGFAFTRAGGRMEVGKEMGVGRTG